MPVPIIYIFRGWEPYLELSVRQAARFNPESRIYHVSGPGSRIATGAIGVDDTQYRSMADRFVKSYRHMSVNPESFELFCFQRWMIAYEMMTHLSLDEAILMDGDVLLWAAMDPIFREFAKYGMSWTEPDQPGTVFVARRQTLQELCESILWHYETEAGFARLKQEYEARIANNLPAAITDMSTLKYFKADNPGKIGDNGSITLGGRFDHNMSDDDGYETANGLKAFQWRDGIPYGRKQDDGSLVKFYSMHFVGRSKGYMDWFASGRNLTTVAKIYAAPKWVRARIPAAIRKVKHKLGMNKARSL
jgi:hypothetical protein